MIVDKHTSGSFYIVRSMGSVRVEYWAQQGSYMELLIYDRCLLSHLSQFNLIILYVQWVSHAWEQHMPWYSKLIHVQGRWLFHYSSQTHNIYKQKKNLSVGMRLLCSIFSQLFYYALLENSSNYSHLCTLLVSVMLKKKFKLLVTRKYAATAV